MVRANETWERKAAGQQNRNRQTLRKESSIDSLNPLGKQVITGKKNYKEWQFHKNYLSHIEVEITTSEACHQCQAKAGSTEKVEIGQLY